VTTTEPQPVRTDTPGVADAAAMLRGEMGRADNKAALLLALIGGLVAGVGSAAPQLDLTASAVTAGVAGLIALVAAIVLLLIAVFPSLTGDGWPSWHQLSDAELQARLAGGQRTDEVRALQAGAVRKFRRIQYAIGSTLAGVGFLALAAVLTSLL
jgi:hypothetical protein